MAPFNGDPYLELVMARRREEARWGWIPFAVFVAFLLVYGLFSLCLPDNDPEGAWGCMFILVVWGIMVIFHLGILPFWMLMASLRYWEVKRKGSAVAGVLFSLMAPLGMVLMLVQWSRI